MIRINMNDLKQAQRKPCINITPEVDISPPLGTPEYDEWKKVQEKKREDSLPVRVDKKA